MLDEKLKDIIVKNARIKVRIEDIIGASDLIDNFGYDSVQLIQLVVDIEKEFGIEFDDEYLGSPTLTKYSVLQNYVKKELKNKNEH
ncbi:MAG: acyl carrier protein [Bacteroidetes bacterium]|nr:acyl carrier protein [Bacteroidota bacterium]